MNNDGSAWRSERICTVTTLGIYRREFVEAWRLDPTKVLSIVHVAPSVKILPVFSSEEEPKSIVHPVFTPSLAAVANGP